MAEQAYYEFCSIVSFAAAGDPPHKRGAGDSSVRRAAENARCDDGKSPFLEVSRMETGAGAIPIRWRRWSSSPDPGEEYYYIIRGGHSFELETWRRFRDVVKLTEFICFMRRGIDRNAVIEKIWQIRDEFGEEVLLSKTVAPGISSTEIRERIRNGEPLKGLVTEAVGKILEEENAFR